MLLDPDTSSLSFGTEKEQPLVVKIMIVFFSPFPIYLCIYHYRKCRLFDFAHDHGIITCALQCYSVSRHSVCQDAVQCRKICQDCVNGARLPESNKLRSKCGWGKIFVVSCLISTQK